MGRPRRRAPLARVGAATDELARYLCHGVAWCGSESPFMEDALVAAAAHPDSRPDVAGIATAWGGLRDVIVPGWVEAFPGTRPWAWWKVDAPELARRLLRGPGCDVLRHPSIYGESPLDFGVCWALAGADFKRPSEYETQYEYLERLGLLTPAERAAGPLEGDASGWLWVPPTGWLPPAWRTYSAAQEQRYRDVARMRPGSRPLPNRP